jgi:hypothetical protein
MSSKTSVEGTKRKSLNEMIFKTESKKRNSGEVEPIEKKKKNKSIISGLLKAKKKDDEEDDYDFEELCKITEIGIEF